MHSCEGEERKDEEVEELGRALKRRRGRPWGRKRKDTRRLLY